jgi:two-component system, NarL family, sensor kinase
MVLKLGAVHVPVDDARSSELLDQLRDDTKAAVADIRRLVDGLRPPSLDEVGLVRALAQHAEGLSGHRFSRPMVIEVTGPEGAISLPAGVEVAAYRIAMEALTNVVRHAHATHCAVSVAVNGALELSVEDNGVGISDGPHGGVGLSSMRARAAELGGTLSLVRRSGGGTRVLAVLPLALRSPGPAPGGPPSGIPPVDAAQVAPS